MDEKKTAHLDTFHTVIKILTMTFAKNLSIFNPLLLRSFSNKKFIVKFGLIIEKTTNLTTAGPDQPPFSKPEVMSMSKPTEIRK